MWGEAIRRTLKNLECYESLKEQVSRWSGGKVYEFLNFLEKLSMHGLFRRQFLRWLRQQKADKESSEGRPKKKAPAKFSK